MLVILVFPSSFALTTRCVQVQAQALDLQLSAGSATLDASGATATAYKLAGQLAAAGSLLALPIADVPTLHVEAEAAWLLCGGRHPAEHHLFPLQVCMPSSREIFHTNQGPNQPFPLCSHLLQ